MGCGTLLAFHANGTQQITTAGKEDLAGERRFADATARVGTSACCRRGKTIGSRAWHQHASGIAFFILAWAAINPARHTLYGGLNGDWNPGEPDRLGF